MKIPQISIDLALNDVSEKLGAKGHKLGNWKFVKRQSNPVLQTHCETCDLVATVDPDPNMGIVENTGSWADNSAFFYDCPNRPERRDVKRSQEPDSAPNS
jgi:hypothetical protein